MYVFFVCSLYKCLNVMYKCCHPSSLCVATSLVHFPSEMDAEAAAPPTPSSAGRAPLWRLEERRVRKPASANIFGGVALWQLQKLFQAAGDQDAEQRAQLVWGQGGEAELAQALIGLRARGRRRGLKTHRRDGQMGSRWLRAFHHMR